MIDEQAARNFLRTSRSRFVRLALEWLETREDPVDLLFLLSREVGVAFGPWDTFRYCVLLGLTPARAVRELGLDVLVEPVGKTWRPPISEAFAVAHAKRLLPEEPAPSLESLWHELSRHRAAGSPTENACAQAALTQVGAGEAAGQGAFASLRDALETDPGGGLPTALELRALCAGGLPPEVEVALQALAQRAQDADGGLCAVPSGRALRELATLRALGALACSGPKV